MPFLCNLTYFRALDWLRTCWLGYPKKSPWPVLLTPMTKHNQSTEGFLLPHANHHHQSELVGDVAVPVSARQAVLF